MRDLITPEFMSMFQTLRSGQLIYRLTDHGQSPEVFHEKCDNQGPTVLLIHTYKGIPIRFKSSLAK